MKQFAHQFSQFYLNAHCVIELEDVLKINLPFAWSCSEENTMENSQFESEPGLTELDNAHICVGKLKISRRL